MELIEKRVGWGKTEIIEKGSGENRIDQPMPSGTHPGRVRSKMKVIEKWVGPKRN